jgi:hypothetical protein
MRKRVFRAIATPHDDRVPWHVRIDGVPGLETQARSVGEISEMARDLLCIFYEMEPTDFDLEVDIRGQAQPLSRSRMP